jgi:hypothetical protein
MQIKFLKIIILVAVMLIVAVFGYMYWQNTNQTNNEPKSYPTPEWVTDITSKIDLEKCGPTNCEACDEEKCSEYPDLCKVSHLMFPCGPACDALLSYCVNSEAQDNKTPEQGDVFENKNYSDLQTNINNIKILLSDRSELIAKGYLIFKTKSCVFKTTDPPYPPAPCAPNSGYIILSDNEINKEFNPINQKTILTNEQVLVFYVPDDTIDKLILNQIYSVQGGGSKYNGIDSLKYNQLLDK